MPKPSITRDTVSNEALYILGSLRENGRLGRSNKLADVKTALEPSVSLEFDSYFFFLRKFHYIAMDREAQLRLTEQGERVVEGEEAERFLDEVQEYFADQLLGADEAPRPEGGDEAFPPPPPTELLLGGTPDVTRGGGLPPPPPPPDALESLQAPVPMPTPTPAPAPAPAPRRRSSVGLEALQITPAPAQAPTRPEMLMPSTQPPLPASNPVQAAPAVPVAARGGEMDLRYQKFDPIGAGPLGTSFKGRFNPLGLDVCIKELKDIFGYFSFLQRGEVLKRLKKELCAQAQVRHPGVVQVVDQSVDSARPYYVLELLRGSLKEELEAGAGKGVPVGSALRWFLQLAYGLRAAHTAGLTHHNLKPENVLLDAYGNAKLGDFGLTRVVEMDATKGLPQVFMGAGGMAYLPPELIHRGAKEPGPPADVYGLGILLYEMLTGQIPGRRSPLPSEVNPEAPAGLDALFDKMTQDRREQRYPDFDAVLEDFYKAFPNGEQLARGDLILSSEPR